MRKLFRRWLTETREPVTEVVIPPSRAGNLDPYSETWGFVLSWLDNELIKARTANDSTKKTEIQTAALRGRIQLIKDLIALPNKKERQRSRTEDEEDDPA